MITKDGSGLGWLEEYRTAYFHGILQKIKSISFENVESKAYKYSLFNCQVLVNI